MILQKIFLPDQLERRVEAGLIRCQKTENLRIYNYSESCQFSGAWDKYTLACRGLILDNNYNLIAKPMPKFFNLGEKFCPALPNTKQVNFEAYNKIDGSLGIWFHYGNRWNVATRGSFDNDYTRWAEANAPDLSNFPLHWTVMTEICMPSDLDGMPRAVKHDPGVYYLGATDLYQIEGLNDGDVCPSTSAHLWKGPIAELLPDVAGIDELVHRARHQEGTEGWVIRFRTGLRIKIKTVWYLQLFRAISSLNEKHVKELMLKAGLNEWLEVFPEELRDEAQAIYDGIQARFTTRRERIMKDFATSWNADRKTFALSVKDNPERSFLFRLYDKQDIDTKLLLDC